MGVARRVSYGALGGVGATAALTVLRKGLARAGLVEETAPEQVVGRLEELGLADDWSRGSRRVLAVAAHLVYGIGIGSSWGLLLRRERGGVADEAAVGSSLGLVAWAFNWTVLLPLLGADRPPWKQRSLKVLLPVVDHAVFGAVWGVIFRARNS